MNLDKSNSTVRLFLALWPPPPVREALLVHQRGWAWPPGTALVAAERLHITLRFLGAVGVERLDDLRRRLAVSAQRTSLPLAAARSHCWPGGLAVLEWDAPAPLLRLHEALGRQLQALGLPVEERAFRPHVTLARKAAGASAGEGPADIAWPLDGTYALVRSTPGRGYDTLHTYAPA